MLKTSGCVTAAVKKTHSECVVNQTSNLFFCLHGTFTFHDTSEGHLIRVGLAFENKQTYLFHLLLELLCLYCG